MKQPQIPPPFHVLAVARLKDSPALERILSLGPLVQGRYEHWDRLRFLARPKGLTLEDWWVGIKMARERFLKPISLRDKRRQPFRFGTPDHLLRVLHQVDQNTSGQIMIDEEVTNPATRDQFVIRSLIEESITSSQLEGASTTAEVAKHMIRSGRKPTDRSEQMIFNNYQAMQFIRENRSTPLTQDFVFSLHRLVTENTLDDASKAGAFREDRDEVVVERRGIVIHVPPPAGELPERLRQMCLFANDQPEDIFIHPVVRAIILHFWVGYDHPFVDGNGRTARALFYWSMLSQGYWMTEYLSISSILRKAPARYAWAYLLSETDDNDLTYFIDYQLRVLERSIEAMQSYLHRKISEVRRVEALLRESAELNHRQVAVLSHALKHPGFRYSIASHQRSHGVVYETARTDLLDLAQRGLLARSKRGKSFVFSAPSNLHAKLRRVGTAGGSSQG